MINKTLHLSSYILLFTTLKEQHHLKIFFLKPFLFAYNFLALHKTKTSDYMSFQTKGKLHVKQDSQQVTEKFRKREFVLEIIEGQYPEYIKFQLINDKCALLDKYNTGDEMVVSFNLKGKPFQGKTGETVYFTNLDAWKIDGGNTPMNNNTNGHQTYATTTQQPTMPEVPLPTDADDLPF